MYTGLYMPQPKKGVYSFLPKSKRAQRVFAVGSVALIAVSAFYAGFSANRVEASAKEFVAKYQHIDQRAYRAQ